MHRGERVTFCFKPDGERAPKALHVSPLMDMKGVWCVSRQQLPLKVCKCRLHLAPALGTRGCDSMLRL